MNIQKRIFFVISGAAFFSVLLVLIPGQIISKQIIEKQVQKNIEIACRAKADEIEIFLENNKELVLQLSKSQAIENLLILNKDDENYNNKLEAVNIRLKNSVKINKNIYDIFLINLKGIIIASNIEERIGLSRSEDKYFLEGKKSFGIQGPYLSRFFKGQKSLAFSAPIYENVTHKLLGVIVIRTKLNPLNDILTGRDEFGKTDELYLINKDNYMITPSRFIDNTFLTQKVVSTEAREWLELSEEERKEEREKVDIYKNYLGTTVLGTHQKIKNVDWCLMAETTIKEAYVMGL